MINDIVKLSLEFKSLALFEPEVHDLHLMSDRSKTAED